MTPSRLKEIVSDELEIDVAQVEPTTALSADSLTLTEIIVRIEAELSNNTISDDEASRIETFADLAKVMESKS